LQSREYFFAVNCDGARSANAKTDLVAANLEHSNDDFIADHDALVWMPCKHEHAARLPSVVAMSLEVLTLFRSGRGYTVALPAALATD
jgi:hypothetical protein